MPSSMLQWRLYLPWHWTGLGLSILPGISVLPFHSDGDAPCPTRANFDDFLCATTLEEIEIQKPNTANSK